MPRPSPTKVVPPRARPTALIAVLDSRHRDALAPAEAREILLCVPRLRESLRWLVSEVDRLRGVAATDYPPATLRPEVTLLRADLGVVRAALLRIGVPTINVFVELERTALRLDGTGSGAGAPPYAILEADSLAASGVLGDIETEALRVLRHRNGNRGRKPNEKSDRRRVQRALDEFDGGWALFDVLVGHALRNPDSHVYGMTKPRLAAALPKLVNALPSRYESGRTESGEMQYRRRDPR